MALFDFSSICDARVWTTHEEYLVFIAVQNLVGIGVVVLKIREFQLCQFGLKMPIHAPFGEFLGVKIGVMGNFLQFYHSRNAITWD